MTRRELFRGIGVTGVTFAMWGLPGCAPDGDTTTAVVRVLVAAKAHDGETIADMRTRVFGQVQIGDVINLGEKVGWIVWGDLASDIVVLNEDHEIAAGEMATTESADDGVYDDVERPEEWVLTEGDTIAFFMLNFQTIAIAEGSQKFAELLDGNDPTQVVVIRDGKVLEGVDLDTDVALEGDELLIFGGKIAA